MVGSFFLIIVIFVVVVVAAAFVLVIAKIADAVVRVFAGRPAVFSRIHLFHHHLFVSSFESKNAVYFLFDVNSIVIVFNFCKVKVVF